MNVENAVAAVALLWVAGFDEAKLREGLETFRGVKRRFDFHINTPELIYMDDYAHHPKSCARTLLRTGHVPRTKITAVFQPHLYTRTRDFHRGFAQALSLADEVLLVPIYPARESLSRRIVRHDSGTAHRSPPHRTAGTHRLRNGKGPPGYPHHLRGRQYRELYGRNRRRLRERPKK